MGHCNIIYNPNSGRGTFKKEINRVTKHLESLGYTWNLYATESPKHATALMKEHSDADMILVSGGDGTMNEILQAVPALDTVPVIAYIPSGTANDFGKTLGLTKNIQSNLNLLNQPTVKYKDIVESSFGMFNYIAAIGNYVDISYKTTKKMKKIWGFLAYIFFGVKAFFTAPMIQATIETKEQTIQGKFSLILVSNSESVGGFTILRDVKLDDGQLEIVVLPYVPILNNLFFAYLFLFKRLNLPGIRRFKTQSVKVITNHKRPWSLDGEVAQTGTFEAHISPLQVPFVIHPKKAQLFNG